MANKTVNHPLDPFKNTDFDTISTEIDAKNTMKNIEDVIEKKRKDIFDILSTGRANGNNDIDETSLKKMKNTLENKKILLEDKLGEITTGFNISSDNTNLINFCKDILNKKDSTKKDNVLGDKCGELLEKLQNVYLGKRHEKLFSGKKDPADGTFKDLTSPDSFNTIFSSKNLAELQKNIDDFVSKVYNSRDNSFSISKSKLYGKDQAEIAARIAIFLHCMQKVLNEGRISNKTKVKSILNKLENEQIPKIRGIYNLQKEEKAVNAEYNTLTDIRKNDITDITWTDTTTDIDLTHSFEGKSNKEAKDIDFYNLNKDGIKITIGSTTYSAGDIILKDASGEKNEFNTQIKFSSGDYTLCLKIGGNEVEIGKLCIDYSDPKKALFVLKEDADIVSNLNALGIVGDIDVVISIMAVKNVATARTHTGQVSLTRKIARAIKGVVIPPPPPPLVLKAQRERGTTISNVDQVNRAIAEREADEELRERYKNVGWNVLDRANLFLRRKFIKDKIVRKKMKGKSGIDWSDSGQSAAHRHQIEKKENLSDNLKVVVDIDEVNYPETRTRLDTLIDEFTGRTSVPPRTGGIDENSFEIRFKEILEKSGEDFDTASPTGDPNWKKISEIITSNKLHSLSTNIIMQAKQFQAHQHMVYTIQDHIAKNPTEGDDVFNTWCRGEIENYINTYDDIPDFLQQIGLSIDRVDDIKTLKGHTAALAAIQAQALKYRLQILDGGDEAYNVKRRGGFLTRAGRRLDDPTENTKLGKRLENHPATKEAFGWIRGGTKMAAIPTALFFSSMGPLATAGFIGGVSGLTTLLKKKSHYEKENRSYQRMQATNLTDYRSKRRNIANEVAGMKWYEGRFWGKKKRTREQYKDYVLATQDQLELTSDLVAKIKVELRKGRVLTIGEKDSLRVLLADGLARLDFHKETGQNFLGSNNPKQAEFEYKQLQNALIGGSLRLGIDVNDLRTKPPYDAYYNNVKKIIMEGTGDKYDTQGYQKARKRFKRRSNLKAIDSALLTGGVSFGLSYLASSLASRNTVETNDVYTSKSSGTYGGQYNPGHVDESLLIPGSSPTGSINPEMYAHINGSTSEITGCQLYSSVDSLRCTAGHGARELARASRNISASLSNPVVAGNPDLVTAVNNYMTDVTRQVGMIHGLDAGNHDLVIARAYEALNSGVLDPIITSGNTSLVVNPTGFTWINGGVQASSAGTVGQAFRNMGIVGLDYVEKGTEEVVKHVTRAIAIPTGLNTFGSPKSDPK